MYPCLYISLFTTSLLSCAQLALAQPSFTTIITDQPSYESDFVAGEGLADGGSLMVGTGLVNTNDLLAPVQAVTLHNFDIDGNLRWSRGYPADRLVDYRESRPVYLSIAQDQAYVLLAERSTLGQAGIPLVLLNIDIRTGREQARVPLTFGGDPDSLGFPLAFCVVDDAAILIRENRTYNPANRTSTVQVFGLDGLLRATLKKGAYGSESVTAWPAAGLAFIAGARPFGINAQGDTTAFPWSQAQSPENDVLPFVANGNRAVYAVSQRQWSNNVLVLATTDGIDISTEIIGLPPTMAESNFYDFTAWGPDSFAVTVSTPQRREKEVYLFAMCGEFGRILPGEFRLLHHHNTDGSKYTVIAEDTTASPQRRVLAKIVQRASTLAIIEYQSGRITGVPLPVGHIDSTLLDNHYSVLPDAMGGFLAMKIAAHESLAWARFDVDGAALPLPARIAHPIESGYLPILESMGEGLGYAALPPFYAYALQLSVFNAQLALTRKVDLLWDPSEISCRSILHPAGGRIIGLVRFGEVHLYHLLPNGALFLRNEVSVPLLSASEQFVLDGFDVGASGEIVLTGFIYGSTQEEQGSFLFEANAAGNERLQPLRTAGEARLRPHYSPSGDLLVYSTTGAFSYYKRDSSNRFEPPTTGLFAAESVKNVALRFLSDETVLLSYTGTNLAGQTHARLATYQLSTHEFQVLHESGPGSTAQELQLGYDGRVVQAVTLPNDFSAVVVSDGAVVSSVRDETEASVTALRAQSPFSTTINFQIGDNEHPLDARDAVSLCDVSGRLWPCATPEYLGDGRYSLQVSADLPSGLYTLLVGQQAARCMKL